MGEPQKIRGAKSYNDIQSQYYRLSNALSIANLEGRLNDREYENRIRVVREIANRYSRNISFNVTGRGSGLQGNRYDNWVPRNVRSLREVRVPRSAYTNDQPFVDYTARLARQIMENNRRRR